MKLQALVLFSILAVSLQASAQSKDCKNCEGTIVSKKSKIQAELSGTVQIMKLLSS